MCGAALVLSACASGPAVRTSKDLPVKNVVLYRSGVGYFERSGSFEGEALEFEVKQDEVGDFLASLTAVERGEGGVKSISFEVPEPPDDPEEKPDDRVDVRLHLSRGGRHDVSIAYVVSAPLWRPSYRVVFDAENATLLQAWAVVQNTSGEEWKDVRLALTTGSPISFRSDLGTPLVLDRPLVSDEGDVISAGPTGEVALAQEEQLMEREEAAMDEAPPAEMSKRGGAGGLATRPRAAMKPAMPAAPPAPITAGDMERTVRSASSISVLGDSVTRYDIDGPVTVPDGSSTMVAILSQRVQGERAHLFAPDPGVPLSHQHPFAVARLNNATGAVLERGPVSVLSSGAFLGQGVLDTLPRDANTFVPYALDKTLVVERAEHYGQEQGTLVRIQRGMVTVERFSQRTTSYALRNGGKDAAKVYLRHARWGEAELVKPPEGSELTPGKALLPVSVQGKSKQKLDVVERTPVEVSFGFMDQPAADAIELWLNGPAADAVTKEALQKALALRKELVSVQETIRTAEREQAELENQAEETRNNLKAIEKVTSAQDLRARLVSRLKTLDARLAELTKQLVEARTRSSELEVRLHEALEGVTLSAKK
jgi:hypothetical protein